MNNQIHNQELDNQVPDNQKPGTRNQEPDHQILNNQTLAKKTAILPGAIKGIGLAIAKALADLGVRLVLPIYDWLDHLDTMETTLLKSGTEFEIVRADLRYREHAREVVKACVERFGGVDILINNIERGGWPVVHGPYTDEQWALEWQTTVNAKWYLFKEAIPHLKASSGTVVNISSIAGIVGRSGPAGLIFNDCYSLSNRAIETLTQQWAREGAPEVRVNEIQLGLIETRHGPGTRGWGLLDEGQKAALLKHTLLERTGKVEEIAKAVVFLLRDATFMTGATIRIDGGYILGGDLVPEMPKGVVSPHEPTFGGTKDPEGSHQR